MCIMEDLFNRYQRISQKIQTDFVRSLMQEVKLKNGIDQEIAKEIIKNIKNAKVKVQASIKGDEIRVDGKKRDDLQEIISFLKVLEQ